MEETVKSCGLRINYQLLSRVLMIKKMQLNSDESNSIPQTNTANIKIQSTYEPSENKKIIFNKTQPTKEILSDIISVLLRMPKPKLKQQLKIQSTFVPKKT